MMSQSSQSLSSLCSICHTKTPRYKCPRCYTRTCSLACTKLHKARTLCNGVRDPGEYATKRELNAPASFDRDYNFISGVERGIESAGRDAELRGTFEAGKAPSHNPKHGPNPFLKSLEDDQITVLRAPKGMQIARINRTQWRNKGGGISWTVMWHFRRWPSVDDQTKSVWGSEKNGFEGAYQCHDGTDLRQAFLEFCAYSIKNSNAKNRAPIEEAKREFARQKFTKVQPAAKEGDSIVQTHGAESEGRIEASDSEQTRENGQEGKTVLADNEIWHFYLEAPDQAVPGAMAVIPFDGFDTTFCLKDLLRGRTIREVPQIWVCKGTPPSKTFHVLQPFNKEAALASRKEEDRTADARGMKQPHADSTPSRPSKKVRFDTRKTTNPNKSSLGSTARTVSVNGSNHESPPPAANGREAESAQFSAALDMFVQAANADVQIHTSGTPDSQPAVSQRTSPPTRASSPVQPGLTLDYSSD